MLLATPLWAVAHLLANSHLADVVLFALHQWLIGVPIPPWIRGGGAG